MSLARLCPFQNKIEMIARMYFGNFLSASTSDHNYIKLIGSANSNPTPVRALERFKHDDKYILTNG